MAIKLNEAGVAHARKLIQEGEVIHDNHEAWKEDEATKDEYVHFLNAHSIQEYAQWFLAVDSDKPSAAREHYLLPHGDLKMVHRCALLEAQKIAQAKGYSAIEHAIKDLISRTHKK